jgi:hypothetical protein
MLSLRSLVLVGLALLATVVVATDDLKIDVLYKPEECLLKSRAGDLLSMQCVSRWIRLLTSRPV